MERMVSHIMNTSMVAWNQWYRQVATGCTTQSHIFRAFLRDLNDPDILNSRLTNRYMIMTKFCMQPVDGPFYNSTERLIFWYALASYRRQLCSCHLMANNDPDLPDPCEIAYNFIT